MRSRRAGLIAVTGVLLALLPFAAARAQYGEKAKEDSTMMKDKERMKGKMMGGAPVEAMLHGTGGHMAAGTLHVVSQDGKHLVHFTDDFKSDPGSDVHVVLSNDATAGPKSVTVGKLKRSSGEQAIDFPKGVDPGRYSHLLLWSKKDNVVLAIAELRSGMGAGAERMDGQMVDSTMKPMKDKMKDSSMAKPN